MDRKFKCQRGAISVFVMIAMLFFLVTVIGVYTIVSRRAQAQTESLGLIQDKYCRDGEEIVRYDAKITSSDEKIPVYTKEQFWSIGEARAVEIDGKIYDYSSTDYEKYELKNDIIVNIETDLARSKFKDDLFFSDKIMKNGHEILYYYEGKYYVSVEYSDGVTKYSLAKSIADLSASGTDLSIISTTTSGLSGKYYLFDKIGLEVGDYVTYEPSGTYTWQAEYASSKLTPVTDDVTLSSASGQNFNLKSWRVLSIDNKTGKVELVPASPTSGTVRLQGAQGYNNAVYLLNDACSNLYGNAEKEISARSINIEDIESRMTPEALEEAHSYTKTSSGWSNKYGNQTISKYTSNKKYPIIYEKEKLSVINDTKNENGLKVYEQNELIDRASENATDGYLVANTSIQPYQTYWRQENEFMKTAFMDINEDEKMMYNLIMPNGTSTQYWLSSHSVSTSQNYCSFCIDTIYKGAFRGFGCFWSTGAVEELKYALFPIVSLDGDLISGNDTDGWKVE